MKTKLNNIHGLSLTELLMASMLIGIVMVGVMGFNFAMTAISDTSSKASRNAVRAASAMTMLKKDAEKATGDAVDPGIRSGDDGGDQNGICFRYDTNTPITPENYDDDVWFCYWNDNQYLLQRCQAKLPVNVASLPIYAEAGCQPNTFISLATISHSASTPKFFTVNTIDKGDAYTHIQSVDFTLYYREDNSTAVDPLKNPEQILTTRVSPISHSQ